MLILTDANKFYAVALFNVSVLLLINGSSWIVDTQINTKKLCIT